MLKLAVKMGGVICSGLHTCTQAHMHGDMCACTAVCCIYVFVCAFGHLGNEVLLELSPDSSVLSLTSPGNVNFHFSP